jgi:hypothetical protein
VKIRFILLLTLVSLLGVRTLGLHLHLLDSGSQHAAASAHLATGGEDGDAGHATALEIVGHGLLHPPALPPPAGGGLLLLLLLLTLPSAQPLPRAPDALGNPRRLRRCLSPPSHAPPL